MTFKKICLQTPNLFKIGQYRTLDTKNQVSLYLIAMRNIMNVDYSAKGDHSFVSMATLNGFILLSAIYSSTIKRKGTIAFPWRQQLNESAVSHYAHIMYNFYLKYCVNWAVINTVLGICKFTLCLP